VPAAPSGAVFGRPPHLGHHDLVRAQAQTLAAPCRPYGVLARVLFKTLDTLYGKKRTLSKFKVLELVARVPYQTWEQVAYIAITHMHSRPQLARRIYDRVRETREQQDNEQWHLLILEELIARSGKRERSIYYFWIPQAIALVYYHISWLLYVMRPAWSYRLNADFEDHAEHEYMHLVTEHPEWENTPFHSDFATDYGPFDSLADLFRQIGHDERVHKEESISALARPRFG
jgi:ubiquinol oxidase